MVSYRRIVSGASMSYFSVAIRLPFKENLEVETSYALSESKSENFPSLSLADFALTSACVPRSFAKEAGRGWISPMMSMRVQ